MAGLTVREAGCKRAVHLGHLMGFPSWARARGKEGIEWAVGWEKEEAKRESEGADLGLRAEREKGSIFSLLILFFFYVKAISKHFNNL